MQNTDHVKIAERLKALFPEHTHKAEGVKLFIDRVNHLPVETVLKVIEQTRLNIRYATPDIGDMVRASIAANAKDQNRNTDLEDRRREIADHCAGWDRHRRSLDNRIALAKAKSPEDEKAERDWQATCYAAEMAAYVARPKDAKGNRQ